MARFRMFIACLLLAAIPLQGLAAASMLFCGGGGEAHAGAHGHAGHDAAHAHDDAAASGDTALPATGHACSACAACSHSVAINQTPHSAAPLPAPRAGWAEPVLRVDSRATPVPDKPPRA